MRKVSKKRAQQNKAYKVVRNEFMEDNPNCERCNRQATENHHKNGRTGERLLNVNFFMAVCRGGHLFIHKNYLLISLQFNILPFCSSFFRMLLRAVFNPNARTSSA